ncbi:MAG TPA: ATP-binding protein [Dehalococcoidia bacterium]|nr:ATP-binding protein [Dehalococcoidia bacterium]
MSDDIGRVIGTRESKPLEFWLAVDPDDYVQLDEVVAVTTQLPQPRPDGRDDVVHYGVVDQIESAYEGASFHSDVFRAESGTLPVEISTIAHVAVTRVSMSPTEPESEVLVPPKPGRPVRRATVEDRELALYFDKMRDARFPAGLSRDGLPVYGNLEFLDGSRGAHVNISGISGVATKTTYALFLLYGLFHASSLRNAHSSHAIIFNVKGEDLLWLDKPNAKLPDGEHTKYEALGLPVGPFASVGLWAPPQRGDVVIPDTGSRSEGVDAYFWTLREFCSERMLRFLFADADDETSQLGFVITQVERFLESQVASQPASEAAIALHVPGVDVGLHIDSFERLVEVICDFVDGIAPRAAEGTRQAFARRLEAAAIAVAPLIRAARLADAERHRFDWRKHQVNVIDINRLNDRAKRFVVGVVVKRLMEEKDTGGRDPLVFLVLDELNKYAPREGRSPIKEVVLDIAERGRSLGVVLVGAEQTASEIERRVTANASFRVVGRLDAAESQRDEYGFLTSSARVRASILKPGSMFLQQPDVPVPLLVQFPFPAWATRADEVAASSRENGHEVFARIQRNNGP